LIGDGLVEVGISSSNIETLTRQDVDGNLPNGKIRMMRVWLLAANTS
jgi:hypothetical protein